MLHAGAVRCQFGVSNDNSSVNIENVLICVWCHSTHGEINMKSINVFKTTSFTALAIAASALAVSASPLDAASKPAKTAASKHTMTVDGFGQIPTTLCAGLPGAAVTMELGEVLKNLANNGKPDRKITRELLGGSNAPVARLATVGTS